MLSMRASLMRLLFSLLKRPYRATQGEDSMSSKDRLEDDIRDKFEHILYIFGFYTPLDVAKMQILLDALDEWIQNQS